MLSSGRFKTSWELTPRSWAQSPEVLPAREHVRSPLSILSVDSYGVPFVGEARRQVIAWNRGVDKPTMQADTRERLMDLYRPDLAKLNDLLGLDVEERESAARS